jgi:hypothetical protein
MARCVASWKSRSSGSPAVRRTVRVVVLTRNVHPRLSAAPSYGPVDLLVFTVICDRAGGYRQQPGLRRLFAHQRESGAGELRRIRGVSGPRRVHQVPLREGINGMKQVEA